jgi:hypothetical protein
MTGIVERLRFRFTDPAKVRGILVNPDGPEAADEIERLRSALVQYRDDLFYLPTGEEKLRRIKMVKQLLEGK